MPDDATGDQPPAATTTEPPNDTTIETPDVPTADGTSTESGTTESQPQHPDGTAIPTPEPQPEVNDDKLHPEAEAPEAGNVDPDALTAEQPTPEADREWEKVPDGETAGYAEEETERPLTTDDANPVASDGEWGAQPGSGEVSPELLH